MYPYEIMLATMMLFTVFIFGYGVLAYVLTGIFLSKILKKAGHKTPYAAWIPLWSQVTLFQLAGLRGAWAWIGVLVGGALLGALLTPFFIGSIISLAVSVFAIIISVYAFKAIQKATGVGDVGYIVLGVIFPWIWIILQANAVERNGYDHAAAFRDTDAFPMNWFGEGDRYGVFLPGVLQVAPAPSAPGYAAPGYASAPMYPAPSAPTAPAPGFTAPTETSLTPPATANPATAQEAPAVSLTPPADPAHSEIPVAGSLEDLLAENTDPTLSTAVDKSVDNDESK